jgi:hypothetical protein
LPPHGNILGVGYTTLTATLSYSFRAGSAITARCGRVRRNSIVQSSRKDAPGHSTLVVEFNVLNEIAYEFNLVVRVRNLALYEFFLNQHRQFNDIEQVQSEIIPEMRVNDHGIDIHSETVRNKSTDPDG